MMSFSFPKLPNSGAQRDPHGADGPDFWLARGSMSEMQTKTARLLGSLVVETDPEQ